MRIHVQTRGRTSDYAFLGSAPETLWWLAFRDVTSFEKPTIIVSGDRVEWHVYVSGIRSRRADRVGTAIRFTLVLQSRHGEAADDALRLVSAWLSDVTAGDMGTRVQTALDESFDEATVERLLADRTGDPHSVDEVERLAFSALQRLPQTAVAVKSGLDGSWVGSASSPRAREAFLAQASEILGGHSDGMAALLNLVATVDDLAPIAGQAGPLGVLIDVPAEIFGEAIIVLETKNPPPLTQPAPRDDHSYDRPTPQRGPADPAVPRGSFELEIDGVWGETSLVKASSTLRLKLCGQRMPLKLRRAYHTNLKGTISVEGLCDCVELDGTLDVTVPEHSLELTVNFIDSHGVPHHIKAKTISMFLNAIDPTIKGTIRRGEIKLGKVGLQADWNLLRQTSPSLI